MLTAKPSEGLEFDGQELDGLDPYDDDERPLIHFVFDRLPLHMCLQERHLCLKLTTQVTK